MTGNNKKNGDILLSVHDGFLERPSSDRLKIKRLEGQLTYISLEEKTIKGPEHDSQYRPCSLSLGVGFGFMVINVTFSNIFSYIVAVSFIGGANSSARRKPLTYQKSWSTTVPQYQ